MDWVKRLVTIIPVLSFIIGKLLFFSSLVFHPAVLFFPIPIVIRAATRTNHVKAPRFSTPFISLLLRRTLHLSALISQSLSPFPHSPSLLSRLVNARFSIYLIFILRFWFVLYINWNNCLIYFIISMFWFYVDCCLIFCMKECVAYLFYYAFRDLSEFRRDLLRSEACLNRSWFVNSSCYAYCTIQHWSLFLIRVCRSFNRIIWRL